jgi:large subunit ribosomal protein L2
VASIEYDPNRTANIASIYDISTKKYFYILAPINLNVGNIIKTGSNAESKIGHSLTISKIPVGLLYSQYFAENKKKSSN